MNRPYRNHLTSSRSLLLSSAARRGHQKALRLERKRRFEPLIREAQTLKAWAAGASCAAQLLSFGEMQPALLTAAGVSGKTAKRLDSAEKWQAMFKLIRQHLEPAEPGFAEVLTARYLAFRKRAFSRRLRNPGRDLAQRRLTRSILAHLKLAGKSYRWLHSQTDKWTEMPEEDADVELHLRGLSWRAARKTRTLVFNLKVPLVGNNVDICLFDCTPESFSSATRNNAAALLALGELKGGIDPAGADEHWKTAGSALRRIHEPFAKQKLFPSILFIGAAIEAKMASEIWSLLESGVLENAANLTNDDQMASITRWLCSI